MHRTCSWMTTLLVALAVVFSSRSAHAQQLLKCVQPVETKPGDGCVVTLARNPAAAVIVVKVEQAGVPLARNAVHFRSTGDAVLDTLVYTDGRGEARTTWSGTVGPTPTLITARTAVAGQEATLTVQVKAPGPPATALGILPDLGDDSQTWYEERQLRRPITVIVTGATTPDACNAAQVAFRATGGGSTSPDTVRGLLGPGGCIAEARWRLGQGVGDQHLRAQLVGEPAKGTLFRATARARPRLTTGLAVASASGYHRLVESADTVTVTRELGDSTVVTKRVTSTSSPREVEHQWEITPVLGFDWPLWTDLHWLRVSAAASLENPTSDWYAGFSLLQLPFGVPHESAGASLHLLAHIGRRTVVENVSDCLAGDTCETDDKLSIVGWGAMFVIDGTTLLSNLATIFGIR